MTEAMVQVHVDVDDVVDVIKVFRGILQPANLAEFLRVDGARVLQTRADARFNSRGDSASGPWAPLRFATEEIREAKGFPPGPINERTHELFDYVTKNWGTTFSDGKGAIMEWPSPDPTGELFEKFETAQKGKASPPTVKRPVVAADETDMDLMMAAFATWFSSELAGTHAI